MDALCERSTLLKSVGGGLKMKDWFSSGDWLAVELAPVTDCSPKSIGQVSIMEVCEADFCKGFFERKEPSFLILP